MRDAKIHHGLRKDWNNAFNTNALRDYREPVESRVKQLRDHLQEEVNGRRGEGVDLAKWLTNFS